MKVIVLEDNISFAKILEKYLSSLENYSIEIDLLKDQSEFYTSIKQSHPDLLISDYYLDDFTGVDALEYAHKLYPDLPVILISSYLDEDTAVKTMDFGFSDIIMKDDMRRFIPAVKRELQKYNKHKQQEKDLQETKKRYRALVHSVSGIVWEASLHPFSFNYISPKIRDILGYDTREWYDDPETFFSRVFEDDRERVRQFYIGFYDHTGDTQIEYRIINNLDSLTWVHDSLSYHHLENQEPVVRGMMIDISQQKEKENQLKKVISERESLISEVHHRVKNNLAVVSGMMQLQVYTESDPVVKSKLTDSVGRIKTMANIHEVLYNSLSSTTKFGSQNAIQLVTDIIDQYQLEKDRPVFVSYNMSDIKLNINHAVPLALIINEVVTNCLKHAFTDSNDRRIEFSLTSEINKILLKIDDNGIGIPSELLDKNSNNTLGLTIINALSSQLEAEYSYEPNDNGTSFTFSFHP